MEAEPPRSYAPPAVAASSSSGDWREQKDDWITSKSSTRGAGSSGVSVTQAIAAVPQPATPRAQASAPTPVATPAPTERRRSSIVGVPEGMDWRSALLTKKSREESAKTAQDEVRWRIRPLVHSRGLVGRDPFGLWPLPVVILCPYNVSAIRPSVIPTYVSSSYGSGGSFPMA